MNIYQENGYESREHYFKCLSEDYECPMETILELSYVLGEGEDFDGLVCALRDYEGLL